MGTKDDELRKARMLLDQLVQWENQLCRLDATDSTETYHYDMSTSFIVQCRAHLRCWIRQREANISREIAQG